jgi:hypothetical protein
MRHARGIAAIASALCVVAAGSCESAGKETRPTGSPSVATPRPGGSLRSGPVTDSAPYWCDLVPRRALTQVSGLSADLSEIRNAGATKDSSICGVRDKERYGPLVVQWNVTGGRDEIAAWIKDVESDHPTALPAPLGSGFIVYSQGESRLPYFTASAFSCGTRDSWIEIFVRSVSSGRDATRDLTDLMRVAQGRFGKLHRCTPRPIVQS